jgi:putative addiction module killer protein
MLDVRQTIAFKNWFEGLKDHRARERIALRTVRLQSGLFGDTKFFDGIGELRIDYGPGYHIYFTRRGDVIVFLLWGGDKGSQARDILKAQQIARDVEF